MKKSFGLLSLFLITLISVPITNNAIDVQAASSTLPTTIKLKDNSEQEIRDYYSSLASLDQSELRGENLLKNLQPILARNNQFYDYGTGTSGVGAIYMITDRNWDASPANDLASTYGIYDAVTNTIKDYNYKENPYIFHYYVDRDYQKDHPIKHKEEAASRVSFDKEHIWAKSHGFGLDDSDNVPIGAGTDLHHLVAANPSVNSAAHNNDSYGYVATNSYNPKDAEYLKNNKRGAPKTSHSEDTTNVVFEPQDSDKGDIARALCYMVARYNYIGRDAQPTKEEPNLMLVNHIVDTNYDCEESKNPAPYGVLTDILEWNKLDKVDGYEIHRNNLIYNNYQNNRNPFIDFPTWIELIWNDDGTFYTGEKFANPISDEINAGSEYVPTVTPDGPNPNDINIPTPVLIVLSVVALIVLIIIIVAVAKGKAKVKVTKSGKVKITAKKSSKKGKSNNKRSSSKSKNS